MFYSKAIAFGWYPFPSVSYVLEILKSKNFLDFFTNLFEGTPSNSYVLEMEETDIFRCFQRNFFLRLIATGEAGILLSSYLLWTTATQNHGRICKFVPLLTAMYLKEEKIPISSCFSEKIFKIFRSTLQLKESISFCQLCSQKL